MQFELKPLHLESVPRALDKAERYRLLNEPKEAESICRDVLAADPANQKAIATLALALSDQFRDGELGRTVKEAEALAGRLTNPYDRAYHQGLIAERGAKAKELRGTPGFYVYEGLRRAMAFFEHADRLHPDGNEDAVLRWNTCARMIMADPRLVPESDTEQHGLGE